MQRSTCEIYFGVSGLQNPSLTEKFYPPDLPRDWRLDYYSNEFRLVLIKLADLNLPLSTAEGSLFKAAEGSLFKAAEGSLPNDCAPALLDSIMKLLEDSAGEDFIGLFDLSELPEDIEQSLLELKSERNKAHEENLYFINLKKMTTEKITFPPVTLQWLNKNDRLENIGSSVICYVTDKQSIEPVELKSLIECIRSHALTEGVETVNVIFSSPQNALDNCRNAILLESMM